jgi:hypothetical protein
MKKILSLSIIALIVISHLSAQKHGAPYIDNNGLECALTWNAKTGTSKLFYYKGTENKFVEAKYQLPTKPTGDEGKYGFMPYLDNNGLECALTWNAKTGTSKLFYYKGTENKFVEAKYQLPTKPTGDEGEYGFMPYVDNNGLECALAWNTKTGTSKLYYYKGTENKFVEAKYQLPTKPTGDEGEYGFMPYLDNNGLECALAWNTKTGTSKLFYYKGTENKFVEAKYQLPTKPTGDEGEYGFMPYLDNNGLECALTWNAKTGTSKLFYYKGTENKFVEAKYQLPTIE